MKLIFKLVLLLLIVTSCKNKIPVPEGCGELKTHTIDYEYNQKYQLPDLQFSVEYFSNMMVNLPKEGKKNSNFVAFVVDDGGDAEERIAFGSYKLTGITEEKLHESMMGLLESVENLFKFSYKLTNVSKEKKTIDGKELYTFESMGTPAFSEEENAQPVLIRTTLRSQQPLDSNGLMVMQIANPNGAIKTHDDFAGNSCTAYVYKTITF